MGREGWKKGGREGEGEREGGRERESEPQRKYRVSILSSAWGSGKGNKHKLGPYEKRTRDEEREDCRLWGHFLTLSFTWSQVSSCLWSLEISLLPQRKASFSAQPDERVFIARSQERATFTAFTTSEMSITPFPQEDESCPLTSGKGVARLTLVRSQGG